METGPITDSLGLDAMQRDRSAAESRRLHIGRLQNGSRPLCRAPTIPPYAAAPNRNEVFSSIKAKGLV